MFLNFFSELTTAIADETTVIPELSDDYDSNNFDIGQLIGDISRPPIGDIGRPIGDIGRPIDDIDRPIGDFPDDDDTDTNCTYDQYECKNGICIATQKICDGEKGRLPNMHGPTLLVQKANFCYGRTNEPNGP